MAKPIQWKDLFVIIDDGHVTITEYERLEPLVKNQAQTCPDGLACLVIIPEAAAPPPARVRRHLQGMLSRLPIRGLSYLVEGTGFKAAGARAVLISLGIFRKDSYPTKVATSLEEALRWLLSESSNPLDVRTAMRVVREGRAQSAQDIRAYDDALPRRMVK